MHISIYACVRGAPDLLAPAYECPGPWMLAAGPGRGAEERITALQARFPGGMAVTTLDVRELAIVARLALKHRREHRSKGRRQRVAQDAPFV